MEEGITKERYSQIKNAVQQARSLGITDRPQIAEAVIDSKSAQRKGILEISKEKAQEIDSVAQKDIRSEPEGVIDRAINKYFKIKEGSKDVPFIIDAVHWVIPGKEELKYLLNQVDPDDILSKQEKDGVFSQLKNTFSDENTEIIAEEVSKKTNSSLITAKRSKAFSEANRYWWKREAKKIKIGAEEKGVVPYEYSRRSKAALFWSIDKILHKQGNLDEKAKLVKPFYRLSIHGMVDNPDYDFAISGSRNLADDEKIQLFYNYLRESIREVGLKIDNDIPKVVIATKEDPKTKKFSGVASLNQYRKESIESKSQHPSFGDNFQNIQLEISARLRKDPDLREKVIESLVKVVQKIQQPQTI